MPPKKKDSSSKSSASVSESKLPKSSDLEDDDIFVDIPESKELSTVSSSRSLPRFLKLSGVTSCIKTARLSLKDLRSSPSLLASFTTESLQTIRSFLFPANRIFKFTVGFVEPITVDSSGNLGGSSGANLAIVDFTSASEWSAFAGLFDEVYCEKALFHYLPHNPYRANAPATNRSATGMTWTSLHHGSASYTSCQQALSNPTTRISLTCALNFTYQWTNVERVTKDTPNPTKSGTASTSQGWISTNATSVAAYSGSVQYLGTATIADWTSLTIAEALVQYCLWFRSRA
jgi:hypothetical protein